MKPTKDSTGKYLELELTVVEGGYKGRKVWARLNLENRNPEAVRIAKSELSAICRAVGVLTPRNSGELHNIPLVITVKVKPGDNGPQNEVKGYAAVNAQATQATGQPVAQPQGQQAPATAKTPPWQRR